MTKQRQLDLAGGEGLPAVSVILSGTLHRPASQTFHATSGTLRLMVAFFPSNQNQEKCHEQHPSLAGVGRGPRRA